MSNFSLTIAIPTFNRNELLAETVEILLPQLSEEVNLVILDNQSPAPVEQTLAPMLSSHENGKLVAIIRNKVNVGGDGNILRSFEHASGRWLWIVADDDLPDIGAVAIIRSVTDRYPDADFFNFYSPHLNHPVRTQTFFGKGLSGFLDIADDFGSYVFIPACLFRTAAFAPRVPVGLKNVNTSASQMAMAVSLLQDGANVCQSHEIVVRYRENYQVAIGWSDIHYAMGASLLPEMVRERRLRRRLSKLIMRNLSPGGIFRSALLITRDIKPASYGRFLYVTTIRRAFFHWYSPGRMAASALFALTLFCPKLTYRLLVGIWQLFKRPPNWTRKRFSTPESYTLSGGDES